MTRAGPEQGQPGQPPAHRPRWKPGAVHQRVRSWLLALARASVRPAQGAPMRAVLLAAVLTSLIAAPAQADEPAAVQVMVLGTYHMNNPKHDLHNVTAEDVT